MFSATNHLTIEILARGDHFRCYLSDGSACFLIRSLICCIHCNLLIRYQSITIINGAFLQLTVFRMCVFFTGSGIIAVGFDARLVFLFNDDPPQLIGKVLLGLLSFCLERVDISLPNDPYLNFLLGSSYNARHAQIWNGQTKFEMVDRSSLLIWLLQKQILSIVFFNCWKWSLESLNMNSYKNKDSGFVNNLQDDVDCFCFLTS